MIEQTQGKLSLLERAEITKVVADGYELLLLDSIWTDYLATTREIPNQDHSQLKEIVSRMINLLSQLRDGLKQVTSIRCRDAQRLHSELVNGIVALSKDCPASATRLHLTLSESGTMTAGVRHLIETFIDSVDEEIATLNDKMSVINSGRFVPGDIRGRCVLGLVLGILLLEDPPAAAFMICAGCGCGG